jgi:hypothetical protein
MSNAQNITTAVLEVAVHAFSNGDPKPIDEVLSRRKFLTLTAKDRALLTEIDAVRQEGGGLDLLRPRLLANHIDLLERLEKIETDNLGLSPAWWMTQWDLLQRPFLSQELSALAGDLGRGETDVEAARQRIEQTFKVYQANGSIQEETFMTQVSNDPTVEPVAAPPMAWIDGLLFPGYVNLSGTWKSGKTWFCLVASICIQAGIPFLGRNVRKGKVAWIQIDMPVWSFLNYCRQLRAGMGLPEIGIPFMSDGRIDLKLPEHQRQLAAKLKELGTEILFIDSGRGVSTVKENDSDEVAGITRSFLCAELRDRLGITVVLITHAAKGGTGSRGSGEWDAACDSTMVFTKTDPDSDTTTVSCRGRHFPATFTFEIDDLGADGGDGVALREVEARKPGRPPTTDTKVEDFLRAAPAGEWYSLRSISASKKDGGAGVRFGKAKEEVERLCGRGLVEHDGGTEGSRKWRWCPNCRG